MKHWLQLFAVLVMVLVAGMSPRQATAAPSVGSAGTANTTRIINDIIRRTPGVTSRTTTGTGVTVSARGVTNVNGPRGLTIPIPDAASATIPAGRIAGGIARAIRVGSWVGVASVVIPWVAEQSGIKVCPPPDFFCKPSPDDTQIPQAQGGWSDYGNTGSRELLPNGQAVCDLKEMKSPPAVYSNYREEYRPYEPVDSFNGKCPVWNVYPNKPSTFQRYASFPSSSNAIACPDGWPLSGGQCVRPNPKMVPASETEIAGAVEKAMNGNPTRVGQGYDAISGTGLPMFLPTDTVTVPTPQTVTAPRTVTVAQEAKPDGSLDTVTTTTDTVVKPKVEGNTLGDAKITYPTTTTTTITRTNNVTNQTTTTTNVTNNYLSPAPYPPAPPVIEFPAFPEPEKGEFPDDYNREVTQKSILQKIEEFTKPITTTLPDGNSEYESIQAKNEEGLGVVAGITPETVNVKNWFPSVPTTACVDPQVPVPLGSGTVTFPICTYVNTFSNLISGVIAFFCILGCVHQVQSALKA